MVRWAVSILLVGLSIGVAGCSRPYDTPVIAQEPGEQDASFDGITDLVAQATREGKTLHVIWTHGMCSHDTTWVTDRVDRVTQTLGGTATPTGEIAGTDQLTRFEWDFHIPSGKFDATFILWSPMTKPFKQTLLFDSPGTDPASSFPYQRASLNNTLKTGLMNDCLADAVVYAGQNGDTIRESMKRAVCYALGGKPVAGQPCDLSATDRSRPLAIATESLGSKFLFDAVRSIWADASEGSIAQQQLAERLASISMVYLLANQMPLLDIASPLPGTAPAPPGAAPAAANAGASSLGNFLQIVKRSRATSAPAVAVPSPTVVAFTDPNDLLSYRLLPAALDLSSARLINVITTNDPTWFGFLERPDFAHCGYAWNRRVIGLVSEGHKAGEAIPESPTLTSGQCF
jgi:hypothetical protein